MLARLAVLALFALGLAGCDALVEQFDDYPPYRYRLTVEVETPEGLRSGSSVIEVDTAVASDTAIPIPGYVSHRLRGEAVPVDLPNGQVLFALLRSEDSVDWAKNIMFRMAPDGTTEDGNLHLGTFRNMVAMTEVIELPATLDKANRYLAGMSALPMLVTFGDLSDPTSVTRVDPDDLAASFGEGTQLKRITVQITDDPVTTGIEERLTWFRAQAASGGGLIPMIKNERGRYEVVAGCDASLADLGLSNFSTEAYK